MKKKQKFLKKLLSCTTTMSILSGTGMAAIASTVSSQVDADVKTGENGERLIGDYHVGTLERINCTGFEPFAALHTDTQLPYLNYLVELLKLNDFEKAKKSLEVVDDVPYFDEKSRELYSWTNNFEYFIKENQQKFPGFYDFIERGYCPMTNEETEAWNEQHEEFQYFAQIFHLWYEWLIRQGKAEYELALPMVEKLKEDSENFPTLLTGLSNHLSEVKEEELLNEEKPRRVNAQKSLENARLNEKNYQWFASNEPKQILAELTKGNLPKWQNHADQQYKQCYQWYEDLGQLKEELKDSSRNRLIKKAIQDCKVCLQEMEVLKKEFKSIGTVDRSVDSNFSQTKINWENRLNTLGLSNYVGKLNFIANGQTVDYQYVDTPEKKEQYVKNVYEEINRRKESIQKISKEIQELKQRQQQVEVEKREIFKRIQEKVNNFELYKKETETKNLLTELTNASSMKGVAAPRGWETPFKELLEKDERNKQCFSFKRIIDIYKKTKMGDDKPILERFEQELITFADQIFPTAFQKMQEKLTDFQKQHFDFSKKELVALLTRLEEKVTEFQKYPTIDVQQAELHLQEARRFLALTEDEQLSNKQTLFQLVSALNGDLTKLMRDVEAHLKQELFAKNVTVADSSNGNGAKALRKFNTFSVTPEKRIAMFERLLQLANDYDDPNLCLDFKGTKKARTDQVANAGWRRNQYYQALRIKLVRLMSDDKIDYFGDSYNLAHVANVQNNVVPGDSSVLPKFSDSFTHDTYGPSTVTHEFGHIIQWRILQTLRLDVYQAADFQNPLFNWNVFYAEWEAAADQIRTDIQWRADGLSQQYGIVNYQSEPSNYGLTNSFEFFAEAFSLQHVGTDVVEFYPLIQAVREHLLDSQYNTVDTQEYLDKMQAHLAPQP